ncbi:MAG TPA: NHL repeat-containing protein [Opitutus sp.]|nr:NHL repeat-containing protein [Opitutus sp.]
MTTSSRHTVRRFATWAKLFLPLMVLGFGASSGRSQTTPYLYLTNRDGYVVKGIDEAGTASTFLFSGSGLPNALFGATLDSSGNLYVAVSTNDINDRIVKITPAGVLSVYYAFNTPTSPTDLVFDQDGNLYVGSQAGRGILEIAPGGASLSTFAPQSSLINRPFGLAFDDDGYLYVSNFGASNIARFDSSGTGAVWATLPAASNPWGITFDNSGNLLVVRNNANAIDRITPGGVETTIATINDGTGLTFDPSTGYAYVISQGNTVYQLAPDGSSTTLFSTISGISGPSNGLVSGNFYAAAVPEPSTYAALAGLAAGFAVLCLRRRRRPAAASAA